MNKKMIFSIVMLWMSLSAYATGQEGDVIYIDGIQWELLGKPVYADSTLSRTLKEALPVARVLHQWRISCLWNQWVDYPLYARQRRLESVPVIDCTTNKFDKTSAENRAKSTKRSARVKFAKYEALCASD